MEAIDVGAIHELVNAAVTAVSILGGAMAGVSGYVASREVSRASPAEVLAEQMNKGLATGFNYGAPTAAIVFIIVL